jgi:hypothetical protein
MGLFGRSTGIKITPCFANHLSKQAKHGLIRAFNAQTLMRVLGDQQTYGIARRDISPNAERFRYATKPTFGRELDELANTLRLKVLGDQNKMGSTFPFTNTYSRGGDMALVTWSGKWKGTAATNTQARRQRTSELLRFALTNDAGSDCYYCFCSSQWETVKLRAHCDACKACRSIHRSHCDKCKVCTLACVHPPQKTN